MINNCRIPTLDDFQAYDGAHCSTLWERLPEDWLCPACRRSKFEIMRWTKRWKPITKEPFFGWMAGLHTHHDHREDCHGGFWIPRPARFRETVICDQCNAADGRAKKKLGLPEPFSYSPEEIGQFVTATPHERHSINFPKAQGIYSKYLQLCSEAEYIDLSYLAKDDP